MLERGLRGWECMQELADGDVRTRSEVAEDSLALSRTQE